MENATYGLVYLIKEQNDIDKWLKKNINMIFINELNEWHTDENDFPKNRTYKMFMEWLNVEAFPIMLGIEETAITKI